MKYEWIDEYILKMPGVTKDLQKDWNWIRYQIGGKMFAAVCLDDNDKPYYITLKLEPLEGDFWRKQYEDIIPGYYMMKNLFHASFPGIVKTGHSRLFTIIAISFIFEDSKKNYYYRDLPEWRNEKDGYQYYGWISDGQDDPYIKGYADDLCRPKEEGHTQQYIRQKPSKISKYRAIQQPTMTYRYRVGGSFFV